ncbi:MAG TPA: TetR/AcrR family transcriptional regulator [Acidimicrobiales bacterium]|jgi:AcrR family transcriptional regulator|nr:TetR/AcrR family transcriptional regulator [Acidimicrobiales bacterium]
MRTRPSLVVTQDLEQPASDEVYEEGTPAILGATLELLEEFGYDRLRTLDVSDRSGTQLSTISHLWPTKEGLVADAIRAHAKTLLPPPDDDPIADLRNVYESMFQNGGGQVVPGLLAVLRIEPDLAAIVRTEILAPMHDRIRADLAKLLGPDDPRIDLLVDLGPSLFLYRTVVGEGSGDKESVSQIIDLITACR